MKKYKLKVLYFASDRTWNRQYYNIDVIANSIQITDGSIIFYKIIHKVSKICAVYPTNITIIESIDELES